MAKRPMKATFTNSSVDVLNAIRNEATINYQNYVPVATPDAEVIRKIGATLLDYPMLANEFLNSLIGRIGKVIITNKLYENPMAVFKKGMVEMGETIEDIFVDLAKPHTFDPEASVTGVYARELPKVRSAFYVLNYQKFYKSTVSQKELRTAFLSIDGVANLISKIITAMYTAANYDEFQVMKYMLAVKLYQGQIGAIEVPAATAANAKTIAATFKATSNDFEFLSRKYNLAGVNNLSKKEDQYLIINSKFDAIMDVEVLASAFNMTKAEFLGHRLLVDGFGELDTERLTELFADDPSFVSGLLTDANKATLNSIPAVLVDKEFFQVYDNLIDTGEKYNEEGLYWNYWLHRWATYALSPFANGVVFAPFTQTVTAVAITGTAGVTFAQGESYQLGVNVTRTNWANKEVTWSLSDGAKATIDDRGRLTIASDATTFTVTATSVFDPTVSDTDTITLT